MTSHETTSGNHAPPDADSRRRAFESLVLPHARASYKLARHLMGKDCEAKDVVQEALLCAFKAFDSFEDRNPVAWLQTIVRNVAYNALRKNKRARQSVAFDEELHGNCEAWGSDSFPLPDEALSEHSQACRVREAIGRLPLEYREVIVLRELNDLSYREIAAVLGVPEGTAMSRLSRGRECLRLLLENTEAVRPGKFPGNR